MINSAELCGNVAACREPLTVTITEATALIGIGRTRMYELIAAGDLTTIKIGRRRLVHMHSLRRLASGNGK